MGTRNVKQSRKQISGREGPIPKNLSSGSKSRERGSESITLALLPWDQETETIKIIWVKEEANG